jgi:Tfp pilus assembly protein PilF
VEKDRLDLAELQVDSVLAKTPSDPQAHALRGFLSDVRGDPPAAIAAYRAALYLEPGLYQVRLLLAECLQRRGEGAVAERQYREVLTLLASGREKDLSAFASLPVPDRERAERRSRQALGGG